MNQDEDYMRRALVMAARGEATQGAGNIGCVIVRDGTVLAETYNETNLRHDPTAHAEIVAIRRACEALGANDLRGATLYTTLQPCGMCAMASIWAKIARVVFGAAYEQVHEMYFEDRDVDTMKFIRDAFRADMSFTSGVLADECQRLYPTHDADIPESEQVTARRETIIRNCTSPRQTSDTAPQKSARNQHP